jgi:predicted O-linked N-acetylglucosamine transferase (SPINDLY family)
MKTPSLDDAMCMHRNGELDAAAAEYEAVLAVRPNESDALHLLGMVRQAKGDPAAGEVLVRKAIEVDRNAPTYHSTLGAILGDLGKHDEAIASCQRAVGLARGRPELIHNLGRAFERAGRTDEAIETYKKGIAAQPRLVLSHVALGHLYRKTGKLAESLGEYMIAIALDEKCADAHCGIAAICKDKGELDAAIDQYGRAIAADPRHLDARIGIARTLLVVARIDEARTNAQKAVAIDKGSARAHNALGEVFRAEGKPEEAMHAFKRAEELAPEDPQHVAGQALVLAETGHLPLAIRTVEALIAKKPEVGELHELLAELTFTLGDLPKARASIDRAITLSPDRLVWRSFQLGLAHADPDTKQDALFAMATDWGSRVSHRVGRLATSKPDRTPSRVLNIGFLSADLRAHPVGYCLEAFLPFLNRKQVRVHCYANQKIDDEQTRLLQRSVTTWRNVRDLSDEAIANQIRDDQIDILIDLSGHTNGNRLEVLARKPAPIQVTWLGYFATTGLKAVDWVLADAVVLPPEGQQWFVERPWLLDGCYVCVPRLRLPVPVGPLPMASRDKATFGCFNNLMKISEPTVRTWARVLDAVPGSRLVLKTHFLTDDVGRRETAERFARYGVREDRLTLLGYSARLDLLRVYNEVDVALDPFPYSGGTTTLEALWMGVPVVCKRGDSFISRVSETLLTAVGVVDDMLAKDEDDYVEKARALASDPVALSALRASLRDQILLSPLADGRAFARRFDAALRGMWLKYLEETQ